MKVNDTIICIKEVNFSTENQNYDFFTKGKNYKIVGFVTHNDTNWFPSSHSTSLIQIKSNLGTYNFFKNIFKEHFITIKQIRKQKLDKLKNLII